MTTYSPNNSWFKGPDGVKKPNMVNFAPDDGSLIYTINPSVNSSVKFILINLLAEWIVSNPSLGVQIPGSGKPFFTNSIAVKYTDIYGVAGDYFVHEFDNDTLALSYHSTKYNLQEDYTLDYGRDVMELRSEINGSVQYQDLTNIRPIFLGGVLDPRGISFSQASYMFSGADTIQGDIYDDIIYSDEGDDLLFGMAGNDTLNGENGDDRLIGGEGNDKIYGGLGNDSMWGSNGSDYLDGGEGDDDIYGSDGTNTLGQDGDDYMIGGAGNDSMRGEDGADTMLGGVGNDYLHSGFGNDIIDGGAGNDLIHGGNGADVITGGAGRDELHGDFGRNTYKSEKDGISDLIAIKSDQYLVNWYFAKAGNNPNGERADIIEGLDSIDRIKIIGVASAEITYSASTSIQGVTGIGIYGKGALEAIYSGGNLTLAQIQSMTSGDASIAAMSNSISSYGTW
jgi:Ca2+-binding RTX toxin-like protein